jgi:hypothetical protein
VRITTATSTPPSTFSRSDVAVSLEESPPFPRKRQPMAEDGEDVKSAIGPLVIGDLTTLLSVATNFFSVCNPDSINTIATVKNEEISND